jgi:hypothetical protein
MNEDQITPSTFHTLLSTVPGPTSPGSSTEDSPIPAALWETKNEAGTEKPDKNNFLAKLDLLPPNILDRIIRDTVSNHISQNCPDLGQAVEQLDILSDVSPRFPGLVTKRPGYLFLKETLATLTK